MKTIAVSFYPWITQYLDPKAIGASISEFVCEVARRMTEKGASVRFEVLGPMSVPMQVEWIRGSPGRLALMNPLGFALARARPRSGSGRGLEPDQSVDSALAVQAIAVALRPDPKTGEVGKSYRAQLYTHRDSGISSIAQLRGRTIGFGTPQSTSNFLMPAHMLRKSGLHPLTTFCRTEFLGGHDDVAQAVYERRVDAGAGHDGAIVDLARKKGSAAQVLTTIQWTEAIPSDPVVVNLEEDGLPVSELTSALVEASATGAGKVNSDPNADFIFWGGSKALAPTSSASYDDLNIAVADLGLSERDLIR